MRNNHVEEYDDRINCRVGDLKKRLEEIEAADPGKPGMSVIVRRLLAYGLEHEENCKKKKKEVA